MNKPQKVEFMTPDSEEVTVVLPNENFTMEWVRVGDIDVDRLVQRSGLDILKIERIKRRFNRDALGVITLSVRNAVTKICLDGMHRTRSVLELYGADEMIYCRVFRDLTIADEAQIFLDLNAGNQPHIIDKFNVRAIAGDQMVIDIQKIVRSYGWDARNAGGDGYIQCVGTLEKIQRRSNRDDMDPPLLQLTIVAVTRAWGLQSAGAKAAILEGVAAFIAEYSATAKGLDFDRLIQKLKGYTGGPYGLYANAEALQRAKGMAKSMAVADILVEAYNTNLRTEKLPPWSRRRL